MRQITFGVYKQSKTMSQIREWFQHKRDIIEFKQKVKQRNLLSNMYNDIVLIDLCSSETPKQWIKPLNCLPSKSREMRYKQSICENRMYSISRLFLLSNNSRWNEFGMHM